MPTIRELVGALRQRPGVEAAVILGRDGLTIDSRTAPELDSDGLAALVPGVLNAGEELGLQARRRGLRTAVLEYESGVVVASVLSADATLLVVAAAGADVGRLLHEIRRNRERMAALV